MNENTIFQAYRNICRLIKISAQDECYVKNAKRIPGNTNHDLRLCKTSPNHVFSLGGKSIGNPNAKCYRYDL